jgi:hypothetical protein
MEGPEKDLKEPQRAISEKVRQTIANLWGGDVPADEARLILYLNKEWHNERLEMKLLRERNVKLEKEIAGLEETARINQDIIHGMAAIATGALHGQLVYPVDDKGKYSGI